MRFRLESDHMTVYYMHLLHGINQKQQRVPWDVLEAVTLSKRERVASRGGGGTRTWKGHEIKEQDPADTQYV